ncbi:hypothetical protein HID58_085819 [Brassica napus]|uniref:Uncharacterized protein n=1 Tax=Brassica napus TaxID=3708 RepID=A0ABQ7XNM3_BRANA|nr:hypothetical protein HID58_085819 [Brassica napus]
MNHCAPLIQAIKSKFMSWTVRLLSFAGRLQPISTGISGLINFWTYADEYLWMPGGNKADSYSTRMIYDLLRTAEPEKPHPPPPLPNWHDVLSAMRATTPLGPWRLLTLLSNNILLLSSSSLGFPASRFDKSNQTKDRCYPILKPKLIVLSVPSLDCLTSIDPPPPLMHATDRCSTFWIFVWAWASLENPILL